MYGHQTVYSYCPDQHSHLDRNIPVFIPHIVYVFNMNKLYRFSIEKNWNQFALQIQTCINNICQTFTKNADTLTRVSCGTI